jgi:basic membrane lipoprotein Med (substrate-binding protein (PBP1-ABC) superfamily)
MVNAFALGAEMTNPHAKIILRWAGTGGNQIDGLLDDGISVISGHDVPSLDNDYMNYGHYGTFLYSEGRHITLASPCWLWGTFYEQAVRAILTGSIDSVKGSKDAVNFLLGMDAGVIDVTLGGTLPDGVKYLAENMKRGIAGRALDIFHRRIIGQDGAVLSDGSKVFTKDELMHMDKFVSSVEGDIPDFEDLSPQAQSLVRLIGVHKEEAPQEIEVQ